MLFFFSVCSPAHSVFCHITQLPTSARIHEDIALRRHIDPSYLSCFLLCNKYWLLRHATLELKWADHNGLCPPFAIETCSQEQTRTHNGWQEVGLQAGTRSVIALVHFGLRSNVSKPATLPPKKKKKKTHTNTHTHTHTHTHFELIHLT